MRILEQVKPSTVALVFSDLLSNSPKCSPRFSPGYEGKENMFYFLNVTIPARILQKNKYFNNDGISYYLNLIYINI